MTATSPAISVVIPLFNKRPFIRRAVDSVLSQTVPCFELIVVDDGSSDGGSRALSDIVDPRLKVVRQQNRGVGVARNTGMGSAAGDWIAFLDADDAWLPLHLAELQRMAQAFPQAGLVATSHVEAAGYPPPTRSVRGWRHSVRQIDYFRAAGRAIGVVNSSTAAIRRQVFLDIGGFSSARAGEDLEYWARVALSYPVIVSTRVTAVYVRHTGGVMMGLARENAQSPQEAPTKLSALSPSVAMLCARADREPSLLTDPSIRFYINGRLNSGIRASIYRRDFTGARGLARMMLSPLHVSQRVYRDALRLPDQVLGMAVTAYSTLKRLWRKVVRHKSLLS